MKENTMATDKSLREMQWEKDNCASVRMKLNRNTDSDILAWLAEQPNKQGYIKELIRADMRSKQSK